MTSILPGSGTLPSSCIKPILRSSSSAGTPLPAYEDVASPTTPPESALVASAQTTPQALQRGSWALDDDIGGRDTLDRLIEESQALLEIASESLSSIIESREHLRRFYALDTAFERSLMLSEHEIRRRMHGVGPSEANAPEKRPSLLFSPPPRELAPRPSLASVHATSMPILDEMGGQEREAGSSEEPGVSTAPSDQLSVSMDRSSSTATSAPPITPVDVGVSRFSPAGLYASWLGTSTASAPPQQSAKDALRALASSRSSTPVAVEEETPAQDNLASLQRSKHRRAEAVTSLSASTLPISGASEHLVLAPSPLLSRSMPAIANIENAPGQSNVAISPARQASPKDRPRHDRKPSRQPSLSGEGILKGVVPRQDGTHGQRVAIKETLTAKERLLGALGGRT